MIQKKIEITLLVDDEDADLLEMYCSNPRVVALRLHTEIAKRFLGERPQGYHTDHINKNWMDNRRSNLRYIPATENITRHSNPSSGYYGVFIVKSKKGDRFYSRVKIGERRINLGTFDTAEEAAVVYDSYIRTHNLKRDLNFPDNI